MLRQRLSDDLKRAMRERSEDVSTLRMMLAAIKDRDIAVRSEGRSDGIGDGEIEQLLQKMIRQRQESIALYRQGGRPEFADKEQREIELIQRFLPRQLDEAATAAAVEAAIAETGAETIKDMGRVMASLKATHSGSLDFARAGAMVKERLK